MAIKTYNDQVIEHINFLRAEGLNVDKLEVNPSKVVNCREIGQTSGRPRGEFFYITRSNKMQNGYIGLVTCYRGRNGEDKFKTYGLGPDAREGAPVILQKSTEQQIKEDPKRYEATAKRAYGFWINSSTSGRADYLDSKGVGSYGIRFRNNEYGRVAVIPMRDIDGKLWSYQLLNPKTDAKPKNKHFATGPRADNLFHFLKPVIDGRSFGVAESYVTAATCLELTGLPMVCIFSSIYFESSCLILQERHPNSKMILFADNDRHLANNIGVLKAQKAQAALKENVLIAAPDFGIIAPSKDASDWNDLVRLQGVAEAKRQLNFLGIIKE
jgi:phage/plasmid primase-like uncharacterized protein